MTGERERENTGAGAPTTPIQGFRSTTMSVPLGLAASCLIYSELRLHILMTHRNDTGTQVEFDSKAKGWQTDVGTTPKGLLQRVCVQCQTIHVSLPCNSSSSSSSSYIVIHHAMGLKSRSRNSLM